MNSVDLWDGMKNDTTASDAGLLVRRVAPESTADLYVGLQFPGGYRLFLVTVSRGAVSLDSVDLSCEAIEIDIIPTPTQEAGRCAVALRLLDEEYSDLFQALVRDIIEHTIALKNENEVVVELVARLLRWRRFLRNAGARGLGLFAQRGLFGELTFLRRYLLPSRNPLHACESWKGPEGADQDFQLGPLAIEVKTTTTHRPQVLSIASERQLDTVGLDKLLLYFVLLDVRSGAGQTLPECIEGIRDVLRREPLASRIFEEKLLEAGYLDSHAKYYVTRGYTPRDEGFFEIRDGFPRITEDMLPAGVGAIKYSLLIAACTNYQLGNSAISVLFPPS